MTADIEYLDFPAPPACTCLCHRGQYAPVVAVVSVHSGDAVRTLDRCQPCTDTAEETAASCGVTVTITLIGSDE
jgi:hypothetical protein